MQIFATTSKYISIRMVIFVKQTDVGLWTKVYESVFLKVLWNLLNCCVLKNISHKKLFEKS